MPGRPLPPGARRLRAGVYVIEGTSGDELHLDVPELLAAAGLEDTEANRDLLTRALLDAAAEHFPDADRIVR